MTSTRAARAAAVLFILTAALFVVGVTTEPGHNETAEATHDDSTEGEPAHEAAEGGHDDTAATDEVAHNEDSEEETVLGIDVESPVPIAIAVIVSIALAAGLWFRPTRLIAIAAIVFAALFAVLDIAEVIHQLDDDHTGHAVLAAVIAAGHIAAVGASAVVARTISVPRSTP